MKKKKVLIADDDIDFLKAVSARVRNLGCQVLEVQTGFQAACELLLSTKPSMMPDIAILDIQMPEMDGLAICEDMMHEGVLDLIPTVVMTGRSDAGTRRRVNELGCYYVKKSTEFWPSLDAILQKLLNEKESETESMVEEESVLY